MYSEPVCPLVNSRPTQQEIIESLNEKVAPNIVLGIEKIREEVIHQREMYESTLEILMEAFLVIAKIIEDLSDDAKEMNIAEALKFLKKSPDCFMDPPYKYYEKIDQYSMRVDNILQKFAKQ